MEKWFIRNKNNENLDKITEDFGVSQLIAKLLINRDISEMNSVDTFLNPSLERLYSPILMKDVVKASNIIIRKISTKKIIRIVGDFDVDGVMSVYILYKGLKMLGANVDYVIPNRVYDGYGINNDIVQKAKDDGVDTIITCDNGIAAFEQVKFAKNLGIDVIITDHHDIPYVLKDGNKEFLLPEADAIINPKQLDCKYPLKILCGAGVVFKLMSYLFDIKGFIEEKKQFLEFVAIATICDVVDLVDENRIFVKYGLDSINGTKNIGLQALIETTSIKNKRIDVYHVGFIIGPTINASGRLDSAIKSLELLLEEDYNTALEIASSLCALNDERKELTVKGVEKAILQIENKKMLANKILLIYEPEIHESIAGIIAGKIKDKYNRPTIILTNGNDCIKGSARSIENYNIYEELSKSKDILDRFGGHPMAAGLSMKKENINELSITLNKNTTLTQDDLISKIYVDMELPIEYIDYNVVSDIKTLEPFGKGNSKPIFGVRKLNIKRIFLLGQNRKVIKMKLESKNGRMIEGIYFGDVDNFKQDFINIYGETTLHNTLNSLGNNVAIDILFYPDINEFNGNTNLQLIIKNYRF